VRSLISWKAFRSKRLKPLFSSSSSGSEKTPAFSAPACSGAALS